MLVKQRKELQDLIPKGQQERAKRLLELETACSACEAKVERLRRKVKALDGLLADAHHIRDYLEPARFAEMKRRFVDVELSGGEWQAFQQQFVSDPDKVVAQAKKSARVESDRLLIDEVTKPTDLRTTPIEKWPLTLLRAERDKVKKEVSGDAERLKKYDLLKRAIGANETAMKKLDAKIKNAEGADARRKDLLQARRDAYGAVFETFVAEQVGLEKLYAPLHAQLVDAEGALAKLRFSVKREVRFDDWCTLAKRCWTFARIRGSEVMAP
jgi:hypothetical protein